MVENQPVYIPRPVPDLETSLAHRVLAAEPILLLSDRDSKRVEVARDVSGDFVRRSYSQRAIDRFERVGIPFTEAFTVMRRIFDTAGIEVVPSNIFHPSPLNSEFPVVVASEYLDGPDIIDVSTYAKIQLATGLGVMVHSSEKFHLGAETFQSDMFRTRKNENGTDQLVFVDIDPYLIDQEFMVPDIWDAAYIKKFSGFFWDEWCKPDERRAVIGTFLRSLMSVVSFDRRVAPGTSDALMSTQAMTKGLDMR